MQAKQESRPALRGGLLLLNGIGILVAAGFSAQGIARPNFAEPDEAATPLARFWAASSAVRTWSLAAPALIGLLSRRPTSQILTAAGLVQIGDSALGVWQRNPQMVIAPGIMGVIHLVSARLLRR